MKTSTSDQIYVKSHVARDLMQNSAVFKTDKLVVWEYVANGLQYVDPNTNSIVKVELDSKKKRIAISDNGRGMTWEDLKNFFVMHGENLDRKKGLAGRGRFGTGKSAAFGIADVLRITTVRNKRQSRVELNRTDIETMKSEDPIPVHMLEKEIIQNKDNGTIVEIENIHLKALDQAGIINYIERHLARWSKNVSVIVNNHECEFSEPPISKEYKFKPDSSARNILGDVELVIKVSKVPLEEDMRGISIYSNGVWHETTLAGNEGRDMAQYIFGELDIPKLDTDKSPIAPFDLSRSMHLNPNNNLVGLIYAFIGQKVEAVRRDLVENEKKRKANDEAKKLEEEASEIAKVINQDFDSFRQRLIKAKAKVSGGSDAHLQKIAIENQNDDLFFGTEIPAEITADSGGIGSVSKDGKKRSETVDSNPRAELPQVIGSENDDKKGRLDKARAPKQSMRGGFHVKFGNNGTESHRAQYISEERTIYINLDHPQLIAAKGLASVEDPIFRRLAYEVAFSEYAVALAYELARHDEYIDPSDPIYDIRETLNRIARRAANLYS